VALHSQSPAEIVYSVGVHSQINLMHYVCGSQSVIRESQGIRDKFPENTWIHFCKIYFEFDLFFQLKEQRFVKNNRELL
jgi:hypothetical protein